MHRSDVLWRKESQVLRVAGRASERRVLVKQWAFLATCHVPGSKSTLPFQALLKLGFENQSTISTEGSCLRSLSGG